MPLYLGLWVTCLRSSHLGLGPRFVLEEEDSLSGFPATWISTLLPGFSGLYLGGWFGLGLDFCLPGISLVLTGWILPAWN